MPKQPETATETVPETAKHISIEIGRLFRPIAPRPLRCGSAMPSAPLAAHRSNVRGGRTIGWRAGRQKGPRHRHEQTNARNSPAAGADRSRYVAVWWDCPVLRPQPARVTVTNLLPPASHRNNHVIRQLKLLRFPSIARCCEVTGTGLARSRPARSGRNADLIPLSWDRGPTKGGWGRWHPGTLSRPIIDLLSIFRGSLPKVCDRSVTSEILGGRIQTIRGYK
jgi:hypothetical protein